MCVFNWTIARCILFNALLTIGYIVYSRHVFAVPAFAQEIVESWYPSHMLAIAGLSSLKFFTIGKRTKFPTKLA